MWNEMFNEYDFVHLEMKEILKNTDKQMLNVARVRLM